MTAPGDAPPPAPVDDAERRRLDAFDADLREFRRGSRGRFKGWTLLRLAEAHGVTIGYAQMRLAMVPAAYPPGQGRRGR